MDSNSQAYLIRSLEKGIADLRRRIELGEGTVEAGGGKKGNCGMTLEQILEGMRAELVQAESALEWLRAAVVPGPVCPTEVNLLRQAIDEAVRYCEFRPTGISIEDKQQELFLARKGLLEVLNRMLARANAEASKPARLIDHGAGLVFELEGVNDPSVLFTLVRAGKVKGRQITPEESEADATTRKGLDKLLAVLNPAKLSPGRLAELRERYAAEAKGREYDPTKYLDNEDPRR
jgi:hypothetical protein